MNIYIYIYMIKKKKRGVDFSYWGGGGVQANIKGIQ